MLQSIRDHVTGWVAGFIIALLIIPFAFWGVGDYFGLIVKNYAAEVNGQEISVPEFQQEYQARYRQLRQLFGDRFDPELIDEEQLRNEVLDQMINRVLLEQHIEELGYRIGDQQLLARIHEIPLFQENGNFSSDQYKQQLAYRGMSPTIFENSLRKDLELEQLQNVISQSAFATDAQVGELVALRGEQREIAYALVDLSRFAQSVAISDEAVEAYYAENAAQFMTEETVTLSYLEVRGSDIGGDVTVDEAALRELYDRQVAGTEEQEQRHAAHILLTGGDAEAKAEQLLTQLREGAEFSTLAATHSQDPGSAQQGGDLGWVERGVLAGPFEDKLFDMQVGDIAGPVKTDFGVHIIKLVDVRRPEVPSFEEQRSALEAQYRKDEFEQRFYELAEQLTELTYATPDSLQPAAEALDLQIQQVSGVSRTQGSGIAGNSRVRDVAFSPAVLNDRMNSDPIELENNHVVVVRVSAHQPSVAKTLDVVRDEIVGLLRQQLAKEKAGELADSLAERARAGEELVALAEQHGLSYKQQRFVSRTDPATPPALTQAVFSVVAPPEGETVVQSVALDDGGYAVYRLTAVKPGDSRALTAEQLEARQREITRRQANSMLMAYVQHLRSDAKIIVKRENLVQE